MTNATKPSRNLWELMLSAGWVLFVVAMLSAVATGCGPAYEPAEPEPVGSTGVPAVVVPVAEVVLVNRAPQCVALSEFGDRCARWDAEVFRVTYRVGRDEADTSGAVQVLADGVEVSPYVDNVEGNWTAPVNGPSVRAPLGWVVTLTVEAKRRDRESVVKSATVTMLADGKPRRCTFTARADTRNGQPDPVTANTPSVDVACQEVPAT